MQRKPIIMKDFPQKEISRYEVWRMFDKISPKYDFLNHFLTLGLDIYWRKQLIKHLPKTKNLTLIDLATGTGDQLITIIKKAKHVMSGLGIDLSLEMIRLGQKKIIDKPYAHQITLTEGNATDISLKSESVDCVTISFGIRNVECVDKCLKESHRVLTPGGKILILELAVPKNPLIRPLALFYMRFVLPLIGGLISGQRKAYKYLNKTIETFPSGENFCKILKKHDFFQVKALPLSFGIVNLYTGEKLSCGEDL